MESSQPFPDIPVTAPTILRQVGHGAYTRGQGYMRQGQVQRYSFDSTPRVLAGKVSGSGAQTYETSVTFPATAIPGSLAFSSYCSCPVGYDCKHAVALMLTAIDRSTKAKKAMTTSSPTWNTGALTETVQGADAEKTTAGDISTLLHRASDLPAADSALPTWRRALSHTLAARPHSGLRETSQVAGALELKINVPGRFATGVTSATAAPAQLFARPMMKGSSGKWIKGGLSWETFMQRGLQGFAQTSLYTEHEQWFTDFYAVVRPAQSAYTSHRDWVNLSHTSSTLLWQLLSQVAEIGLVCVLDGQEITLAVADTPTVYLDAHFTDDQNTLVLTPILSWHNFSLSAAHFHKLGEPRQGFLALGDAAQTVYSREAAHAQLERLVPAALTSENLPGELESEDAPAAFTSSADLVFVPLDEPLTSVAESLIATEPLEIPASEIDAFYRDFYPELARSVPLISHDERLTLPALAHPELVLFVDFAEQATPAARTVWQWAYPKDPLQTVPADNSGSAEDTHIFLPALGYPGENHASVRDTAFEARVLKKVKTVRPAVPFTKHRWEGWNTRVLVDEALPALAEIDGVHIEVTGEIPTFKELDTEPEITIRVDDTGRRDWFGLGIAVKAGNWYVGFSEIFAALAQGQTHMLLGDGTYFALNRPEFLKLQELIIEASTLNERGGNKELTITRHQAGLWEDLEELASTVETTRAWEEHISALLTKEQTDAPSVPPQLQATLRPYQLEGFHWLSFLWQAQLGGILADDMGLGKTLQTIALIAHAKHWWQQDAADAEGEQQDFAPFLVVAPTSVVPNWISEVERFAPHLKVVGISASQAKSKTPLAHTITGADVVITSYALFRIDEQAYADVGTPVPWNGLILDEAQFVKNAKTKAHRIARELPARFKLAVTGTPLENNLMELWSMFSITAPGLFPSARAFKDYYATPIESGEETAALGKLRSRVRPLMLRRTKELVAADLPEKNDQRVNVPLAAAHRKTYDTHLQRERKKILGLVEDFDKNRFTIFNSLTALRRLALDASLIDAEKYAEVPSSKLDYLEENLPEIVAEGHKALIFSQFTSYLKLIATRLETLGIDYLYLDGTTRDRASALEAWKEGRAPVFLISLKAGGFGLNLTQADYVFIMDPWWNPAAEDQAVDRAHRIGQTKNVMVYRLVSAGTIEEKVMELKESKAALFDAVVDDGQFFSSRLDAAQVRQLLMGGE
ncbi:DEAD/DEAH box helicase [Rothia sp. ZJ1223]|uniref:DEAD/DEAH box helicase n=1 Tax=Rothia sp. ZJ1223 TaxID=2811098 RepID=UPI00195BB976|nr:DEAD/DEAH box helicase [Rothia sp. ZJ1223]